MIKVVDSIMGSGKTSYIIKLLKEAERMPIDVAPLYLVITPYLEQIRRICFDVPSAKQPIGFKSENLVNLLEQKHRIIVCTHELIKSFTRYELLTTYTVLIDETLDVIEVMYDNNLDEDSKHIDIEDINILRAAQLLKDDKDGFLEWCGEQYTGRLYADIYNLIKNKSLMVKNNRVFKIMSRELFKVPVETYIFTYLFEGQNIYYYFEYFNVSFEYYHIACNETDKEYVLLDGKDETKLQIPINIYEGHLNEVGDRGLSKNWYTSNVDNNQLEELRKNIYNYLHNICKAKVDDIIWTTFKCFAPKLTKAKGKLSMDKENKKKGNFVSCTARATNYYKKATSIVYAVNRYQRPEIKQFFQDKNNIIYKEDLFALQEMLQFIWRSAIRENKPVNIYIPSKRMRELLSDWIMEHQI